MDDNSFENSQPTPPRRRRKRSKWQDFKEAYLPFLILGLAAIMIVVFIAGAIGRRVDGAVSTTPSDETQDQTAILQQEAAALMQQAEELAKYYDYMGAIEKLTSFRGDMTTIEGMVEKYDEYSAAAAALVTYTDVEYIPNLSFNMLIADLDRTLAYEEYGDRFNRNYLTTQEFKDILQSLYDKGYILVSIYDVASKTINADGSITMTAGKLTLPANRKPIILTQTAPNYFTYMVDGDGDGLADQNGAGFASRLVLDANGELTCEMVDASGNTVTGAFDFIPILNDFIEAHPDFSYRGAKATIAVTGYDGLFGYRTDPETATKISQEYYDQQLADVKPIIEAIRNDGYDIACYTYDLASYGEMELEDIKADLDLWTQEVTPLLGEVDILVYPNGSDIAATTAKYSGDIYSHLKSLGFCYFVGQDAAVRSWGQIADTYVRQTRRQVTPSLMYYSYSYFEDVFDAQAILDTSRGQIPY